MDLGSFENAVHRHISKSEIEIGIGLPKLGSRLVSVDSVSFCVARSLKPSRLIVNLSVSPKLGMVGRQHSLEFRPARRNTPNVSIVQDPSAEGLEGPPDFGISAEGNQDKWVLSPESLKLFRELTSQINEYRVESIRQKLNQELESATSRTSSEEVLESILEEVSEEMNSPIGKLLNRKTGQIPWLMRGLGLVIDLRSIDREFKTNAGQSQRQFPPKGGFSRPQHLYGVNPLGVAIRSFFTQLNSQLLPSNLAHVGPLRTIPGRVTQLTTTDTHYSDARNLSENLANNPQALKSVSNWVKKITSNQYGVEWKFFKSNVRSVLGGFGALYLVDSDGTEVSFQDVGVGLSQVVPILEKLVLLRSVTNRNLVASVSRPNVLMVEEPELHLHPMMQAKLMGLFIEEVTWKDSNLQIIAETHSEAMLLRIQRAIRDGEISGDDVAIVYVEKTKGTSNSIARNFKLDDFGNFVEPWPKSFSDLRLDEVFGRTS